jgi:Tol biopolymer transport system component
MPPDKPQPITFGSGDQQYPAWISDDAIIYQERIGGTWQIYRLQLTDGSRRPLTPDHCDSSAPVATLAGDWVVFVAACASPASLWRMRADGSELQQLTSGGGDNFPSITGDGKWIYYESLDDGKPIIKRIPSNGGRPERVTTRLSRMPPISPNGDLLAASTGTSSRSRARAWP